MNVEWDNADGIRTLKEKVESVNFPVGEDEEYKDDSNEILKSIGEIYRRRRRRRKW